MIFGRDGFTQHPAQSADDIGYYFSNRSVQPIEASWEKQKQFITDASHELKTPVAIIDANAAALLANEDDTIKNQSKWVEYIQSQTERMSTLINELFYLAKTEDVEDDIEYVACSVSDIVQDAILSVEYLAFEKKIELIQAIEPNLIIKSDPEKWNQIVGILIGNALKYTNPGGQIALSLHKTNRQIVFEVANTGQGLMISIKQSSEKFSPAALFYLYL